MHPLRLPSLLPILLGLLLPACGYRLAPADRSLRIAFVLAGPVHPDAAPALEAALARRLRAAGVRLDPDAVAVISLALAEASETSAAPTDTPDDGFVPAAWDARLAADARLLRPDTPPVDLGRFEGSGRERSALEPAAADRAQASAYALAAEALADLLVAALLAAW